MSRSFDVWEENRYKYNMCNLIKNRIRSWEKRKIIIVTRDYGLCNLFPINILKKNLNVIVSSIINFSFIIIDNYIFNVLRHNFSYLNCLKVLLWSINCDKYLCWKIPSIQVEFWKEKLFSKRYGDKILDIWFQIYLRG